jgi:hypothetical protein
MDRRHFTRTIKGHDEISNRRKTLKGKLRMVLFLIDPNKVADVISEQVALLGGPPDSLAQLLDQGYIEEIGTGSASSVAPVSAAASAEEEVANFRASKAFMNDTIVDALGIRAFGFTLRLERCATRADLVGLLSDYAELLEKKLDRDAVVALVERTRELLSASRR